MLVEIISPMWPRGDGDPFGVFIANIARSLERRGFEVRSSAVIRGRQPGAAGKALAHLTLGANIARSALAPADCVYAHAPTWFAPLIEVARHVRGKRLVLHLHGAEVFPGSKMEQLSKPLVAWLVRRADLVIAPSAYYAAEVAKAFAVRAERLLVSPSGGVDARVFAPMTRDAARASLELPRDAEVVGYVGRIEAGKGWDTFLEALALLAAQRPKVLGFVVGDGAERDAFAARAKPLGARVRSEGFRPQRELPAIYAAMDALLFPARRAAESLGLVPIEALAMGTPVVGSRISAVPEYVVDGKTGYLCAPESAVEFAAATARILDGTPELRRRLSEGARAKAAAYESERVADDLAEALRGVVAHG